MTWRWTGEDVRRWDHLRKSIRDGLDLLARRGKLSKGMVREIQRAIGKAEQAVIPSHDAQEIGRYRAFLHRAQAWAANVDNWSAADALGRELERVGQALDVRIAGAARRLPYKDD